MKKLSLTMVMFLCFFLINAQDSINSQNSSRAFKQEAGNKSLEVHFDPGQIFGSNTRNQFSLFDGGIKFRSFISDKKAFRIGVNLSFAAITNITQQEDSDNDIFELKDKLSDFAIMIKPGFEKHFSDSKRLSPYIGIQGLVGYKTSTYKSENQNNQDIYIIKWTNNPNLYGYGSFDIGLGVFAGVDFYFVKKLYLGIELGYGLQYSNLLKTTYTNEDNSNDDYEEKNGSVFGVAPSLATGNLRFGWTF